ncbi:MAG: FAD-dependent oxidoreductase [Candidatus Gastranaerophilales bacterium]|nr:FAD-dependent oxidoreductase [Candidatus Gastranaerophilales bacterium]
MEYDFVIFGGGTAGVSAAYIAAKKGIKTLLIEKTDVLGGSITQALVCPSMKVDSQDINTEFFNDLIKFSDRYNARKTYIDGNKAWFNPELLKLVLDTMLSSVNCTILFSTEPVSINKTGENKDFEITLHHKISSLSVKTKFILDSTADGKVFKLLDLDFQKKSDIFQTPTLRFLMSNIDMQLFSDWLYETDKDRNVTTVDKSGGQINLSTAFTRDKNRQWALSPIFDEAVKNKDLEYEDTIYFQVFTIPYMAGALGFNCPRIIIEDKEDLSNPFVYSNSLKQGRQRIYRLSEFCKKYFPGFKNAYISHISDMLGVRESNRIKGKYTITKEDIVSGKKFKNIAFACDYPIDIHSNSENKDKLEYIKHTYYVPLECLLSEKYDNIYAAGRIISADFEAQAALRTQMSCFSMGEAVAKDILKKII